MHAIPAQIQQKTESTISCVNNPDYKKKILNKCSGSAALAVMALLYLLLVPHAAFAAEASSKEEASELALEQVEGDGKVLSLQELENHFRVKILIDGKVRIIKVDKSEEKTSE